MTTVLDNVRVVHVVAREMVRAASSAPLAAYAVSGRTLTMAAAGALSIGGVAVAADDLVLLRHEGSGTSPINRIWRVAVTGDGSTPGQLVAASGVPYTDGLPVVCWDGTYANQLFFCRGPGGPIVPGTSALRWTQQPSGGGGAAHYDVIQIPFDHATTTVNVQSIAAGDIVTRVALVVTTAWNGPARVSLGTTGSPTQLFDLAGLDGLAVSQDTYADGRVTQFGAPDTLTLTLTPNGATQGAGYLVCEYRAA